MGVFMPEAVTFPVGCPPLDELLERLQVRPEHDRSRYREHTMSAAPAGLPDYGSNTGAFAVAVKKYRAYLQQHPADAAGWEGLAYLHLRIASGEGKGTGMGAEGLVSAEKAAEPLRAAHQLLSFQSELRALLCEPDNPRFRRSLNTSLALALTDATREHLEDFEWGLHAPIVRCLGGVRAAQELRFAIVEGLLKLSSAHLKNDPVERAQMINDLADVKREMGEYREAIALYEEALALVREALANGERVYLLDPAHFYLWLHLCALGLADFSLATHYLDQKEAEEQKEDAERIAQGEEAIHTGGPATHLRLQLLEAAGQPEQARALALQNADMLLARYQQAKPKDRDPWDMLRRADLLRYAGQTEEASALLHRTLRGLKEDWPRNYALKLLDQIKEGNE